MANTATKSAPRSTQDKADKATAQDAPDTAQAAPDTTQTQATASDTPQQGGQLAANGATDGDGNAATTGQEQAPSAGNATDAFDGAGDAITTGQDQPATTLHSLDELATLYRVPSWQQAALARMQGWEPGKRVTAETYEAALTALGARPQGGR
ncbi:MAG TPA: hypothetical protein VE028_01080 [Nitratidesulfovibrio sp.]|nr:hypothetical protein [Nitratidesulfovibrio sp.]